MKFVSNLSIVSNKISVLMLMKFSCKYFVVDPQNTNYIVSTISIVLS